MTCFFRRVPPFFLVRDDDDDEDVLVSSARWLLAVAAEGFDVPLESTVLFRLSLDLTPPLVGLLVAVADTLPDDEGLLPLAAAAGSICSIFVMCNCQSLIVINSKQQAAYITRNVRTIVSIRIRILAENGDLFP